MADHSPITLEIIRHALAAIPGQIEIDITRTAYSPLIYEYKDFAVGLVDAEGRLICQGDGGIPTFLANILGAGARQALEHYGDDLAAGDVIVSNDAATFGQHLNNVLMCTPVFADGSAQLTAFMCVVVHWIDVGGKAIGSSASNDSTDIFQEGFQFPCIKLRRRGEPVRETYRLIAANSRFPKELLGDIAAQLNGCIKGRQLFEDILARYGRGTVLAAIEATWRQSASAARAAVRAIPDGVYSAASVFDNDGVDLDRAVDIAVTVTVAGETMVIDFSKVSAQLRGPFNSGAAGGGVTAARIAFKYLTTPHEPTNEGSFAPLEVILPDGTFMSAGPTAPLAKFSTPFPTVIDTVVRALAPGVPDAVAAAHHGNMGTHRFSGRAPGTGALYAQSETTNGGWGASNGRDGAGPFKTVAHGDTQEIPVEVLEALTPLYLAEKSFRPDSGGAGRFRGGVGVVKQFEIEAPCSLALTLDRQRCPPWGLFGGRDGASPTCVLERPGAEPRTLLKTYDLPLQPGDRVRIYSGGGGGYGDPFDRDLDRVAEDVRAGYVSRTQATEAYGVVFGNDGSVDVGASARRRMVGRRRSE